MGEGIVTRIKRPPNLIIPGQQVISGEYSETIAKFDSVVLNEIPEVLAAPNWDINLTEQTNISGIGNGTEVEFSNNGNFLAVGMTNSPFFRVYSNSNGSFSNLNIAGTPQVTIGASWSGDDIYLAAAHASSPFITTYKRSGNSFTKLNSPSSSLPPSTANDASFTLDGVYLAVGHASSPFVSIYKRSGDTFTKLSNPNILPGSQGVQVQFSPDGIYLAVGHSDTPFLTIYKRNGDTFTKLTNPDFLQNAPRFALSFTSDSVYLAASGWVYQRNGDVFSFFQAVATGTVRGNSISSNDEYFAFVTQGKVSDFRTKIYKFDGAAFILVQNGVPNERDGNHESVDFGGNNNQFLAIGHSNISNFGVKIVKTTVSNPVSGYTEIIKANNTLPLDPNTKHIGYALDSGTTGETKRMISIGEE